MGPAQAISGQCPGEADAAGPGATLPGRLSHCQLSNCALRREVRAGAAFRVRLGWRLRACSVVSDSLGPHRL